MMQSAKGCRSEKVRCMGSAFGTSARLWWAALKPPKVASGQLIQRLGNLRSLLVSLDQEVCCGSAINQLWCLYHSEDLALTVELG